MTYQFKALCFVLLTECEVFASVYVNYNTGSPVKYTPSLVSGWLALIAGSPPSLLEHHQLLLQFSKGLEIVTNLEKLDLESKNLAQYLGHHPGECIHHRIHNHQTLGCCKSVPGSWGSSSKSVQKLLDYMFSLKLLVYIGGLRMQPLQWHFKAQWSIAVDELNMQIPTLETSVQPQKVAEGDNLTHGVQLQLPQPSLLLYINASQSGWSVLLGALTEAGE